VLRGGTCTVGGGALTRGALAQPLRTAASASAIEARR
jgi:hypothetical protein